LELEVWRDEDGSVVADGCVIDGTHWMHLPGIATFRFGPALDEVTAAPEDGARQGLVRDAYLRFVLPNALHVRGVEVLHASAVLCADGVVAFCARPQTGKSTIAYALGRRGYRLWADDAVAFDASREDVLALPLPFAIRLRPVVRAHFGADDPVEPADHPAAPARLAALCLLERADEGDDAVEVSRLPAVEAFMPLLRHSYWFSLANQQQLRGMMERYLALVGRVPVFRLRFGTGLRQLPAVIAGIERSVIGVAEPTT